MKPSSRIERDRERRITDFVRAGEELFFEKGYHNTSIEDIARRADYAVGTVYRYFTSKENLFEEMLFGKMTNYCEHMQRVFKAVAAPEEKLFQGVRAKLDFFEKERRFFQLFVEEIAPMAAGAHAVIVSQRCLELKESCLQNWVKLLRQGVRSGKFRRMDCEKMVLALEGAMHEVMREHVLHHPRRSLAELEPFLCDFIRSAVFNK